MVEDYKLRRLDSVIASTVNRELNTIKNLFRKAVQWDYLKESVAKATTWMKTSRGTFRFLSREEADLLLDIARRSDTQHLYPILAVALHTGMRRGEILRLQWEDVDFKKQRILVVSREDGRTKNYESRSVPMSRFVMNALRKHPRRLDTPYVFCGPDGRPFHDVNSSFGKAVQRAGIPHVRFHDLRHTFASWLVMKGVDIRTVQELFGHKDIRMTMRYSHLAPDHMRRAVQVLDAPR
jgi:integrase